jgi:hypothetical protein
MNDNGGIVSADMRNAMANLSVDDAILGAAQPNGNCGWRH